MVGFGAFKTMDLMLLSFYDFFDNSDIFNTTLAITFDFVTGDKYVLFLREYGVKIGEW